MDDTDWGLIQDARLLNAVGHLLHAELEKKMTHQIDMMVQKFHSGNHNFIDNVAVISFIKSLQFSLGAKQRDGNKLVENATKEQQHGTNR